MSLVWLPQPQLSCAAHEAAFGAPILHPRRRRRSKTGSSSTRPDPLSRQTVPRQSTPHPAAGGRLEVYCKSPKSEATSRRGQTARGEHPPRRRRHAPELTSLSSLAVLQVWTPLRGTIVSTFWCALVHAVHDMVIHSHTYKNCSSITFPFLYKPLVRRERFSTLTRPPRSTGFSVYFSRTIGANPVRENIWPRRFPQSIITTLRDI